MAHAPERADIWVIDTCSILEIRRRVPAGKLSEVYRRLGELVDEDILVFPKQVLAELERQTAEITATGRRDLPYEWAQRHAERAVRHGTDHDALRSVLSVVGVEELLDPDKKGVEPADPYVLTLAYHLNAGGHFARVISEDRRNAPDKLALASACGLVGVPVVPVLAFLSSRGIWRPGSS